MSCGEYEWLTQSACILFTNSPFNIQLHIALKMKLVVGKALLLKLLLPDLTVVPFFVNTIKPKPVLSRRSENPIKSPLR